MSTGISKYAVLYRTFDKLRASRWERTSSCDKKYNCAAWAAGDTTRKWWPDIVYKHSYYWPPGVEREDSVRGIVAGFATLGYEVCPDRSLEEGFEKIAVYVDSAGEPQHLARQLPTGEWTSKLGAWQDITHHDLDALNCDDYGSAMVFMRRERV